MLRSVRSKLHPPPRTPFEPSVPEIRQLARNRRVLCGHLVSRTRRLVLASLFALVVSGVRKPVPGAGIGLSQAGSDQPIRPSIAVWRDHSTGASRRRVTPMPRGNRPSIAAFTRSGARKARDIVMLTWRTLHPSRLAMRSTSAFASTTSSLSQRRPRAIDAIKVARSQIVSDAHGAAGRRQAGAFAAPRNRCLAPRDIRSPPLALGAALIFRYGEAE